MATKNRSKFARDKRRLADFSKSLAHPARLAILQTIAEKKECICGEIVEVLPLAQATVSQHLKELKEIGLIKGEIEGNKSCYCIDWIRLKQFQEELNSFFQNLNQLKKSQSENCCS